MAEPLVLKFARSVNAPAAEAFRAFTHATALRDWLSNAALTDPRHGGYLYLHWNDGYSVRGNYTAFEPPNRLAFTWDGSPDPGIEAVSVHFEAEESGIRVVLEITLPDDTPEWQRIAAEVNREWTDALENLQSFLEDGIDLRIARRPRLGILYDEFTAEKARRLGVPVTEGILLAGTAENSGAQAAGLRKDDVLVSLNGVKLAAPSSFDAALNGLKAGDQPLVEYYRGAELRSVPLELGHFPIPDLPSSPAELAGKMTAEYRRLNESIRSLVAGLSEEQAEKHPDGAGKEWSVKELVAHFVLCERDIQSWVAGMLRDNVIEDSLEFRPNMDERIDALVARLGTLPAVLDELALAEGETLALLAALPGWFTERRKHLYRRVCEWVSGSFSGHFEQEHADQFKAAVAAAKG